MKQSITTGDLSLITIITLRLTNKGHARPHALGS